MTLGEFGANLEYFFMFGKEVRGKEEKGIIISETWVGPRGVFIQTENQTSIPRWLRPQHTQCNKSVVARVLIVTIISSSL
jgi:hypothetical protein